MTKQEAHILLDLARAGRPMQTHLITEALGVTGDLASSFRAPVAAIREDAGLCPPVYDQSAPIRAWPYYATQDGQAA